MLWLSKAYPYFIQSLGRFGLVHTHLPAAEIIYSGGWIGALVLLLLFIYWRAPKLRVDEEFLHLALFLLLGGLGLWIMEGGNVVTGVWVETGQHLRELIFPWFLLADVMLGTYLWRQRTYLTNATRAVCITGIAVFTLVSAYYTWTFFKPFILLNQQSAVWNTAQTYAKPLAWLDAHESQPVVVWSDPNDNITPDIPTFSKNYVLFDQFAMWNLEPNQELEERYLVAEYFANPTTNDLENDLGVYLGQRYADHIPETIGRRIKLCQAVFFWDKSMNCGTPPSAVDVIGVQFFDQLEQKFQTDIKPNIKTYLKKYHVSYILKNDDLDPQWDPEQLGAVRVYSDGNFELYKLPN
jgi:hypothetical protein